MKPIKFISKIKFVVTDGFGNPKKQKLPMSTEEIRCQFLAVATVFSRHNLIPKNLEVVKLTTEAVRDKDKPQKEWAGLAVYKENCIIVRILKNHDETLTTIIHEYIHMLGFRDEWKVSTLTHKFKPEIAQIASILLDGYYRGAAYLAHTKIAYDKNHDTYNEDQWIEADVDWTEKHRWRNGEV